MTTPPWAEAELRRRGLYKLAPWMAFYFDRGTGQAARSTKELMEDLYMAFLTDRGVGAHTLWWREYGRRLAAGEDPGLPSPEVRRSRVHDLLIPGSVDFLRGGGGDAWSARRGGRTGVPGHSNLAAKRSRRREPLVPDAAAPGSCGDGCCYETDDDIVGPRREAQPALKGRDIDARWLERKISAAFPELDPLRCQKLAGEAFEILADSRGDDRDAENWLAALFDYRELGLVNLLVRERDLIVWCIRLARDQDEKWRRRMGEEPAVSICSDKLRAINVGDESCHKLN